MGVQPGGPKKRKMSALDNVVQLRTGQNGVKSKAKVAKTKQRRERPLPTLDHAEVEAAFIKMAARISSNASVVEAERAQLAIIWELVKPRSCFIAQYSEEKNLLLVAAVRG